MSKRIEAIQFRCTRCGRLSEEYNASVTLQSGAILRLALPKGWHLEIDERESHQLLSLLCEEHSAEVVP